MYRRNAQGWRKHLDFILMDELALQIAYVIAYNIRMNRVWPYGENIYRMLAIVLFMLDLLAMILLNTMHGVLKRGYWKEFLKTLEQTLIVFAGGIIFVFSTQSGERFSRIVLYLTLGFHLAVGYGTRILLKQILLHRGKNRDSLMTMIAVLQADNAEEMLKKLSDVSLEGCRIRGVVLDRPGPEEIGGFPVVATLDDAPRYICREWIDRVYVDGPANSEGIRKLVDACWQMAVPVHYHIPGIGMDSGNQVVEKMGETLVITTSPTYASQKDLFFKRVLDIVGGIIGSFAALILIAVLGPFIKKASPGPILYRQERIGRNGRKFKIIKIRSMYMDADARKAELMADNRVKDGMMFKMDFDPRVIGNEILPDGTKKTGIGDFIRRNSLDEFPQFFNVLKGEMSLVGTRPPTVDEWEKYEFHHRARLACKPGITGMWQVSGRSEITDFEEVVKLDTEYINNWSFSRDLKILFKTIGVVFGHKGAM